MKINKDEPQLDEMNGYKYGFNYPRVEHLSEKYGSIFLSDADWNSDNLLEIIEQKVGAQLDVGEIPLRFAVTQADSNNSSVNELPYEIGVFRNFNSLKKVLKDSKFENSIEEQSIFKFCRRSLSNSREFNVAFVLPTGTGCELGGHSGDAGPVTKLLSGVCNTLFTHPNAVNAADINEIPDNGMYVEGSVLARFLMGTVGLIPVRSNRVLAIVQDRKLEEKTYTDAVAAEVYANCAINMINGGRSSAGYRTEDVVMVDGTAMEATITPSNRATGRVLDLDRMCEKVLPYIESGAVDAIAVTSKIKLEDGMHDNYFHSPDSIANPYGGVEAVLTHAISSIFGIPSAHSPMYEDLETMDEDPKLMDPRTGVEGSSVTFLHCLLKGLHKSPRIISNPELMKRHEVYTAEDVSCLVTPDGCLGLPILAALKQGMVVIAVKDRTCRMNSPLALLPWKPDQFYQVDSYLEAAGILIAVREGISVASLKRPFSSALIDGVLPELDLW